VSEPQDRIRSLLRRGDDCLRSDRPERLPCALDAFEEAAEVAKDPAVEPRLRQRVERRLETARLLVN
jgi:hypothetical protein